MLALIIVILYRCLGVESLTKHLLDYCTYKMKSLFKNSLLKENPPTLTSSNSLSDAFKSLGQATKDVVDKGYNKVDGTKSSVTGFMKCVADLI